LNQLKKEYENLRKTDFKYLAKFGLDKILEKRFKQLEEKIKQLESEKSIYDPNRFSSEKCNLFCENSCDYKYSVALNKFKTKVNSVNTEIESIKQDIFYYKDGKKNKEKYKQELLEDIAKIDSTVDKIQKITEQKALEYNFNYKEITDRGKFYQDKLFKIKNSIKSALSNDNFYLFSKFINEGIGAEILSIFREFKETFKELDKDYFVVLRDKKIIYKAVFSVYSWNDYVDYPEEHSFYKEINISDELFKRLQVHHSDLEPSSTTGTQYFGEIQYVSAHDSLYGNHFNNSTWQPITVSGSGSNWHVSISGDDHVGEPVLQAWSEINPSVRLTENRPPGDGTILTGVLVSPVSKGWYRYEYAVQNVNAHRGVREVEIAIPLGGKVLEMGFHDIEYHSGAGIDSIDWTMSNEMDRIRWTTNSHEENAVGNAIRWGTTYNFWFVSKFLH